MNRFEAQLLYIRLANMVEPPETVTEVCEVQRSKKGRRKPRGCGQVLTWTPAVESRPDCGCCSYCRKRRNQCDCLVRAKLRRKFRKEGDPIVRTSNHGDSIEWVRPAAVRTGAEGLADLAAEHYDRDSDDQPGERAKAMVGLEQYNTRRLEACRVCGADITERGPQARYCGDECYRLVNNAQQRARSDGYVPWTTPMVPWKQRDRSEPEYQRQQPQPWFLSKWMEPCRSRQQLVAHTTDGKVSTSMPEFLDGWSGRMSAVRLAGYEYSRMVDWREFERPARLEETQTLLWLERRDTRTLWEKADRLARRYGTGGTVTRCRREGCDQPREVSSKGRSDYCSEWCSAVAAEVTVTKFVQVWLNTITPEGVQLLPVRVAA